jgi:hypothetical protein
MDPDSVAFLLSASVLLMFKTVDSFPDEGLDGIDSSTGRVHLDRSRYHETSGHNLGAGHNDGYETNRDFDGWLDTTARFSLTSWTR